MKFHFFVLILFLALIQLTQCVSEKQGGHDNSGQGDDDFIGNNAALIEAGHEEMKKIIEIKQSNFKNKFPFMEVVFQEKKEREMDNEYEIDLPYDLSFWGSSKKVLISGDSLLMGPTLFYGYVIDITNGIRIFKSEEKRKYYDMEVLGDELFVLNAPQKTIHRISLIAGKIIDSIKLKEKCREFIFWKDYLITDNYYSEEEKPELLVYKQDGTYIKCLGKRKPFDKVVNSVRFLSSGDRFIVIWPFQNQMKIYSENFRQIRSCAVDTVNHSEYLPEDDVQHIKAFCIFEDDIYYTVNEKINEKLILYKRDLERAKTMSFQMAEDRNYDISHMVCNNGQIFFVFDTGTRIIARIESDDLKFQEVAER